MSRQDLPEDEGFYSRWSRLKRGDKTESEPVVEQSLPSQEVLPEEQAESPPALTDEDMPPIESLTEDSDYTGFMSPGVSEELRTLALRKLFHHESFNVVDGLDDYDEDFTSFTKLGDYVTSDMRYQMEQAARRTMDELLAEDEPVKRVDQEAAGVHQQEDGQLILQEEPVEPDMSVQGEQADSLQAAETASNTNNKA